MREKQTREDASGRSKEAGSFIRTIFGQAGHRKEKREN